MLQFCPFKFLVSFGLTCLTREPALTLIRPTFFIAFTMLEQLLPDGLNERTKGLNAGRRCRHRRNDLKMKLRLELELRQLDGDINLVS